MACATAGERRGNTWITPALRAAYCRLHDLGHAHSVEVWQDGRLVGGTYGVALRGLFAGELMFHRERDASKVALVHLMHHLAARGYQLVRHPAIDAAHRKPGSAAKSRVRNTCAGWPTARAPTSLRQRVRTVAGRARSGWPLRRTPSASMHPLAETLPRQQRRPCDRMERFRTHIDS